MKKLMIILSLSGIIGTSSSNITSCFFNNKSAITKNLDNFNNFKDKILILVPSADYSKVFDFIYQELSNYTHMSIEAIKSDPHLIVSVKNNSGTEISSTSKAEATIGLYQEAKFQVEPGSKFQLKDGVKVIKSPFTVTY